MQSRVRNGDRRRLRPIHPYTPPHFAPQRLCREENLADKGEVSLAVDSAGANGSRPAESHLEGEAPFVDLEEIRALIAQGQDKGYLTFQQIASTLEEVEVTKEQVERLHTYLIDNGVDVIGEDGVTAYK